MRSGLWILAIVVLVAVVVGLFLTRRNENLRAWAEIEATEDAEQEAGRLEAFISDFPGDEHQEEAWRMLTDRVLNDLADTARYVAFAGEVLETEADPEIRGVINSGLDRAYKTRNMLTTIGDIEDPEERIAAADKFLSDFPESHNKDRAYYIMAGTMVEDLQDTVRMEAMANRVIADEPDQDSKALAYYMLYSVPVETHPDKALAAVRRLAEVPIDVSWIYGYIASDMNRRDLEPELAVRLCDRALEFSETSGDSADAFDTRGWIYYGQEKYDLAVRDLEAAVAATEQPDEQYLEHLGKAALKAGDGDRAFDALETLLVLGEYEFARTTLDSLMGVRGYSAEQKLEFDASIWRERIDRAMTAKAFTLPDLKDASFAYNPVGKVTVLDFMSPT